MSSQVFATLDPIVRRIKLSSGTEVLVSDTVGFIRRLPHDLVAAFRATLEEVTASNLILHVIDVSDPSHAEKEAVVNEVLKDLDCAGHAQLRVFNKCDLIQDRLLCEPDCIVVSSLSGEGIAGLKERILEEIRRSSPQAGVRNDR